MCNTFSLYVERSSLRWQIDDEARSYAVMTASPTDHNFDRDNCHCPNDLAIIIALADIATISNTASKTRDNVPARATRLIGYWCSGKMTANRPPCDLAFEGILLAKRQKRMRRQVTGAVLRAAYHGDRQGQYGSDSMRATFPDDRKRSTTACKETMQGIESTKEGKRR